MDMIENVRRASGGDRSFDAFFRAEHHRLAALATALCGDRETGRDVSANTSGRSNSK